MAILVVEYGGRIHKLEEFLKRCWYEEAGCHRVRMVVKAWCTQLPGEASTDSVDNTKDQLGRKWILGFPLSLGVSVSVSAELTTSLASLFLQVQKIKLQRQLVRRKKKQIPQSQNRVSFFLLSKCLPFASQQHDLLFLQCCHEGAIKEHSFPGGIVAFHAYLFRVEAEKINRFTSFEKYDFAGVRCMKLASVVFRDNTPVLFIIYIYIYILISSFL